MPETTRFRDSRMSATPRASTSPIANEMSASGMVPVMPPQTMGQWEAGYTIGMSNAKTLRRIILPQAARVSVPPLSNTFISLVKDTSLASLILVTELFRVAQQIAAFSQQFMLLYLEAALIYWLFCLALSSGQNALERRLDRHVAH